MASKSNIALFLNHAPGLDIAKYFASRPQDDVKVLYLTGVNPDLDTKIIDVLSLPEDVVFVGKDMLTDSNHVDWLKEQNLDALVCVYWPWLLKPEVYSLPRLTVNFHPAYLPINRGWFPHVHSIVDGSPLGVTLHRIEDGADTGAVWVQREIELRPSETAKDIYIRLQREIVEMFKDNWESIIDGSIETIPQDETKAVYHAKGEINELDAVDIDGMDARTLLNTLKARSFGNRGFAYFLDGDEKIYMNLRLGTNNDFS